MTPEHLAEIEASIDEARTNGWPVDNDLDDLLAEVRDLTAERDRLRADVARSAVETVGRMGFRDGLARNACPFGGDPDAVSAWTEGWDEAAQLVEVVSADRDILRAERNILEQQVRAASGQVDHLLARVRQVEAERDEMAAVQVQVLHGGLDVWCTPCPEVK